MSTALIVGKFYPPHGGHQFLLASALLRHQHVVVLCLGSASDSFTPQARLRALMEDAQAQGLDTSRVMGRSGFDEAPFDVTDEAVWSAHVGVFVAHLDMCPPIDTVLTSESYGEQLAQRLGVQHEPIDMSRTNVAISSSQVRANPVQAWPMLGPGTRRMLATRVVLIGAESTGTTTVSRLLAERLRERGGIWAQTRCVEEYGRMLTLQKQDREEAQTGTRPLTVTWSATDFAEVVRGQDAWEAEAAGSGGPILVCDTDAFATPVWERRYLGDEARLDAARLGVGDVYLLTHHDGVPFVQDGLRDGEHLRSTMTQEFASALITHQRPWALLTGSVDERVRLAMRIADQVMQRKLSFMPPI